MSAIPREQAIGPPGAVYSLELCFVAGEPAERDLTSQTTGTYPQNPRTGLTAVTRSWLTVKQGQRQTKQGEVQIH